MRPIRHIALSLLLGLLTAVASALALAAWMPMDMYPRQRSYAFLADDRPWSAVERRSHGMWNIWWGIIDADYLSPPPPPEQYLRESLKTLLGRPPAPDPELPQTAEDWLAYYRDYRDEARARSTTHIREFDHRPPWGTFARTAAPPRYVGSGTDHGFGWPRPALWYRVNGVEYFAFDARGRVLPHASAIDIDGGYHLTGTLQTRGYSFRALPYRIHWPGLLINTALFAILWFTLLFAPGTLRRAIRRKRGRCTACGYDLRGISAKRCPECGGVREIRAVRADEPSAQAEARAAVAAPPAAVRTTQGVW